MSEIQAKLFDKLRAKVATTEPSEPAGPDARDERIAQLERELEAERDNAADLRKSIDEQRFRIEVLEQSYSKQLADARARAEQAETALEAAKTNASELATLRDTLTAERDAAQRELEQMTARERVSLGPVGAQGTRTPRPGAMGNGSADDGLSIDDMLAEVSVVDPRDRAAARLVTNGPSAASDDTADDADSAEDMLAPDLVFSGKDSDDTDA